jgi:methyltransferase FkbM-like protein
VPVEFTILSGPYKGIKIFASPINNQQLRFGLYEREIHPYLIRAARSARWCIDIGAGFGELSLFFYLRANATPVFAVEPWTPNILSKNLAINDAREIISISQYLGTKYGQLRLDSFSVPKTKGFIKIDVDGAEVDVLESGSELIRSLRPYLLIETHSPDLETRCVKSLSSIGYDISIIRNAWWRTLLPEERIGHNRWIWAE